MKCTPSQGFHEKHLKVALIRKVMNTQSVSFVFSSCPQVKRSKSVQNFRKFSLCSPRLCFKDDFLPKFCYIVLKMVLLLIFVLKQQPNVDQFTMQMASSMPPSPFIDNILMLSVEALLSEAQYKPYKKCHFLENLPLSLHWTVWNN